MIKLFDFFWPVIVVLEPEVVKAFNGAANPGPKRIGGKSRLLCQTFLHYLSFINLEHLTQPDLPVL